MTLRKVLTAGFVAACGQTGVAYAGFDAPMLCLGEMVFFDADGTAETYEMRAALGPEGYEISSTNTATGEGFTDRGACTDYDGEGCLHEIVADGQKTGDSYMFSLSPIDAQTFAYVERWADGSLARTVMECTPQP